MQPAGTSSSGDLQRRAGCRCPSGEWRCRRDRTCRSWDSEEPRSPPTAPTMERRPPQALERWNPKPPAGSRVSRGVSIEPERSPVFLLFRLRLRWQLRTELGFGRLVLEAGAHQGFRSEWIDIRFAGVRLGVLHMPSLSVSVVRQAQWHRAWRSQGIRMVGREWRQMRQDEDSESVVVGLKQSSTNRNALMRGWSALSPNAHSTGSRDVRLRRARAVCLPGRHRRVHFRGFASRPRGQSSCIQSGASSVDEKKLVCSTRSNEL